jgi:hypothetical protein
VGERGCGKKGSLGKVEILRTETLKGIMLRRTTECANPSFKGTIDRLNHWLPVVISVATAKLRKRLVTDPIELIAEDQVSDRPFRRSRERSNDCPIPTSCSTNPATG